MSNTREQWLNSFVAAARPVFANAGYPLPERIRVSVGFTSGGRRGKSIGECWSDSASEDGYFEIFLRPSMQSDARICDVLTHELCHAAVGIAAGHGKVFKACMNAVGLGGKATSTMALQAWYEWALPVLDAIGPMPYGVLTEGENSGKPKQKTNLLKVECDTCGFTARVTAKWITSALDNGGTMQCPDRTCTGNFNHDSGEA